MFDNDTNQCDHQAESLDVKTAASETTSRLWTINQYVICNCT